ncbi:MAG: erythromycin esterase [Glaciihabitans sp.]|nr:erythromycin esterase [Glaciihabitans sp.]
MDAMTESEIIEFVGGLPGVVVTTSSDSNGGPVGTWGDSFFSYDPQGDLPPNRRMPFTTIVTQDFAGFDEASHLNRDGVFRVNIAVGRERYENLIGHPARDHSNHSEEFDYTTLDAVLPHPIYATQGWVSVLNPGEQTSRQVTELIQDAAHLAAARAERRTDG